MTQLTYSSTWQRHRAKECMQPCWYCGMTNRLLPRIESSEKASWWLLRALRLVSRDKLPKVRR